MVKPNEVTPPEAAERDLGRTGEQRGPSKPPDDAAAALLALREPFPERVIGLLPKATDKASPKEVCSVCGNFVPKKHIHLSYVGHAAVTDRLLNNDLEWTWEAFSTDLEGLPAYRDAPNGSEVELWIRLTVRGVTRVGVGVVEKGRTDLAKQLVSDAIKNAAMRFGIALDLWSKDELESAQTSTESGTRRRRAPRSSQSDTTGENQGSGSAEDSPVVFDSRLRNSVKRWFSQMDPPVRSDAEITARIKVLLNLDEETPLSKLSVEQGLDLMRALGMPGGGAE